MHADAIAPLERLSALGQSVWVDFLSRESIRGGHLQQLIDRGLGRRRDVEPDDLPEGDDRRGRLRRAAARAGRRGRGCARGGLGAGRARHPGRLRRVPTGVGADGGPRRLRLARGRPHARLRRPAQLPPGDQPARDRRPAQPAGQDPGDQAGPRCDRGRDREGSLDQHHADLLADAATPRSPSPTSAASSASSPREATPARSPRWRASSSRGSTPRPTGGSMRSAATTSSRASSRSPTRSSPTATTRRRSPVPAGRSSQARERPRSVCCGRRPRPRTPPTPTRSTSRS